MGALPASARRMTETHHRVGSFCSFLLQWPGPRLRKDLGNHLPCLPLWGNQGPGQGASLADRIMTPKDAPILTPGLREHVTLRGKGTLQGWLKLRWGNRKGCYLPLSRGSRPHLRSPKRGGALLGVLDRGEMEEEGRRGAAMLALKMQEGAMSQGTWAPRDTGKVEETDSPLEAPGGAQAPGHPGFRAVRLKSDF